MKAMIILLTGPLMLFFTLSVASAAEWHVEAGMPVPWAWIAGIVAVDAVWCVAAARCSRESMDQALRRYEKFIEKLFTHHFK
jgi:hypothetical protein